jgi:hypothetical protein
MPVLHHDDYERQQLLDHIAALTLAMQTAPDAETRAALAEAREALRQFDERTPSGGRR